MALQDNPPRNEYVTEIMPAIQEVVDAHPKWEGNVSDDRIIALDKPTPEAFAQIRSISKSEYINQLDQVVQAEHETDMWADLKKVCPDLVAGKDTLRVSRYDLHSWLYGEHEFTFELVEPSNNKHYKILFGDLPSGSTMTGSVEAVGEAVEGDIWKDIREEAVRHVDPQSEYFSVEPDRFHGDEDQDQYAKFRLGWLDIPYDFDPDKFANALDDAAEITYRVDQTINELHRTVAEY